MPVETRVPAGPPAGRRPGPRTRAAVESEQAFPLPAPVVPMTLAGAHTLGRAYWEEVERTTRGLVRIRSAGENVELRLFPKGPVLLRFGPPRLAACRSSVSCSFAVLGGLLARAEGGELAFTQERGRPWRLRTSVRGFSPRLTSVLYAQVQARLHRALGRRYAVRLMREARP